MYKYLLAFFNYSRQFIYFNYFLIILTINIIINKVTSNNKIKALVADSLIHSIELNGAVLIKMFQWINVSINNIINDKNNNTIENNTYNLIFKNRLENLYENCKVHNFNYTKDIFFKEYNTNIEDVIELDNSYNIRSGSVAQVYKGYLKCNKEQVAIKVVHPNIKYEICILKYFFIIFEKYFLNILMIYLFNIKNLSKILSFNNFIKNIENQINMNTENDFLQYFYNEYKNNEYIIIPKSIFSSKNLLIMEFVDGDNFENMNITNYNKQKIGLLHTLFYRDILYNKQYIHADLHQGNIKIQKYKNFYKLVIYDFGYCIINKFQTFIKNLNLYLDTNNNHLIGELIYTHIIKDKQLSKKKFINDFNIYLSKYIHNIDTTTFTVLLINFIIDNTYNVDSIILELLLSCFIGYKYALKNNIENAINTTYSDLSFLKQYNIFPELKKYYTDILNNDLYKPTLDNYSILNNNTNTNTRNSKNTILI